VGLEKNRSEHDGATGRRYIITGQPFSYASPSPLGCGGSQQGKVSCVLPHSTLRGVSVPNLASVALVALASPNNVF
jgi:hypothetical protein